jgi:hypothetical protein
VIILNINDIVNNVLAGLICSASISFLAFTFRFLKRKYNKNRFLFMIRFLFYSTLFCMPFSFYLFFCTTIVPKWLLILCFIVNILGMIMYFEDAIKYRGNRTK